MKSIILTLSGIYFCFILFAQDTIVLKNGNEIKAKVIEIGVKEIKYKIFDYPDGPDIYISKSNIFMIKFQNGTKTVINQNPVNKQFQPVLKEEKQEQAPERKKVTIQNQEVPRIEKNYKQAIGAVAGFSIGIGPSYRYQPKKLGIQVEIIPYKDRFVTILYSGLTFLYTLRDSQKMIFFAYQSNEYYEHRKSFTEHYFINGLGMGMEFKIYGGLYYDLMTGFAGYENFRYYSLTGETGLFMKF
jgi:hypothetical protein